MITRLLVSAAGTAAAVVVGALIAKLLLEGDNALVEFGDEIDGEAEAKVKAFVRSLDYDLPYFLQRWSTE